MKNLILELLKKPFIRNVIMLSSGTAAAQIIALVLSPVITRLYGPEAYGLMGTFMAIVTIISPIAALTFPIAIVLPKKESEAKEVVQLSLVITFIISMTSALILVIFHNQLAQLFKLDGLTIYLFLVPIVILFAGILQVSEQWLIRTKQFNISAKVAFLQAILTNGGKVVVGLNFPIASVLILFSAFAQGFKALLIFILSKRLKVKNLLLLKINLKAFKKTFSRYKDFPLYRAPEVFLNSISGSLPILLLTSLFGPISAGYYAIGRTVLALPSQLIGKSVGDVFYPRISQAANNRERITPLIIKATISMSIVGVIPFGLVIIFGPWLFSFVFGSEWVIAGEYARWIALSSYFIFANKPSVTSLPVLSAQRLQFIFTLISLLVRILVLFISYYIFKDDLITIISYSAVNGFLNIGLIFITLSKSKKFDEKQ